MKTSALIRSIATEIKSELHTNTAARPNYGVIDRLNTLAHELGRISRRAEKSSERLVHIAAHYYSDSVREKQPEAAPVLHLEMVHIASQIEGVADSYAASGD